jgi:hypothetical protein
VIQTQEDAPGIRSRVAAEREPHKYAQPAFLARFPADAATVETSKDDPEDDAPSLDRPSVVPPVCGPNVGHAMTQFPARLCELRDALLDRGCPTLTSTEGRRAFEEHKLLASAVHRVARLDQTRTESETDAWVRFVSTCFPDGRNASDDARTLFRDWRTSLLKRDAPGPGVAITHGQSQIHWARDGDGRLWINLEDMWADFKFSIETFLSVVASDPRRTAIVVDRWDRSRWEVQLFQPVGSGVPGATAIAGSAAIREPRR